jgi:diaminohydroxyphosphoribosylaminopyrimidine deaminase/5-amino-6-(5-phosphoribosylamino)uracil reductase
VRAVIDSRLRLGGDERIFSGGGEVWIYTCAGDAARRRALAERGARIIDVEPGPTGSVRLEAVMRDLATREINEVHSECGAGLAGALIAEGLADRVLLYLAPHLLGSRARGLFDLGELTAMAERKSCRIRDIRQIGDDLRLTLALE